MPSSKTSPQLIINQTKTWLTSIVVACHFCPFAKREIERDSVFYRVVSETRFEWCLKAIREECLRLDEDDAVETTLVIFDQAFGTFDDFLLLIEQANDLLVRLDYEGIYQLASFHPDYCFAATTQHDPANYTNRSPYPTLHLLREASIERALTHYPQPEQIPKRNIIYTRDQGSVVMQTKLDKCRIGDS